VRVVRRKLDQHRSAGPVDLVIAATAELQGLALLHHDRAFECIAAVTGQAIQWFGPPAGK
jgi:predicted nucleic acid-binding protein